MCTLKSEIYNIIFDLLTVSLFAARTDTSSFAEAKAGQRISLQREKAPPSPLVESQHSHKHQHRFHVLSELYSHRSCTSNLMKKFTVVHLHFMY